MPTPSPAQVLSAPAGAPCSPRALPALAGFLAEVPDARKRQGLRHPLPAVLCLMLAGLLAGRDSSKAIAEWGRDYPKDVMLALGFSNGNTPCPSTLHVIMKGLNWKALEGQLRAWAEAVLAALDVSGQVALAADGKTLRGSLKQGSEVTHLLSVVVQGLGITLSHEEVARKSNEIPTLPKLLSRLILSGRVITMDALLTQREIAAQIVAAKADYVMVVKGNQPALEAAIAAHFAAGPAVGKEYRIAETYERGHGRLEERRISVVSLPEGSIDWPGAFQVFRLERATWRGPRRRAPTHQQSTVYGVTSLPSERGDAPRLLELSRGHWGIENGSHWIRDCVFGEDASQTKTGAVARVMAAFRTTTITLLRVHRQGSIARERRRLQAHPGDCVKLLGLP